MAIDVVELEEEEGTKAKDNTRVFLVLGTLIKSEAQAAVVDPAYTDPVDGEGLYRQPVKAVVMPGVDGGGWICTVNWTMSDFTPRQIGDTKLTFDTGGGTAHLDCNPGFGPTVSYPVTGGPAIAPDTHGLIGVTKDGVAGVDIGTKAFDFSVTWFVAHDAISVEYIDVLRDASWTTNNADWTCTVDGLELVFPKNTVLFKGVGGASQGKNAAYELTGKFSYAPHRTGITVAGATGVTKKAWDYLWPMYEETVDDTAKVLTKRAVGVYTEPVYDESDLAALDPPEET